MNGVGPAGTQTSNRKNLMVLAFTLTVLMLGYGMVIPVMPFLIDRMGASGTELGLLVASYGVVKLIFSPMWGSLSDRVGRRPILIIGVIGNGLAMLFFGLATEMWMLFAARILSGFLTSATSPTAFAYIADSTSEKDRGGGMGMLGAAMGVGTIFGPGLGGWLAGDSLSTPFFLTAALCLVSAVLILLLLPETRTRQDRTVDLRPESGPSTGLSRRVLVGPVGLLLFLSLVANTGGLMFYSVFGLYALEKFEYGPERVGTILVIMGVVSALAQGVLTGPLTKRWGEAKVVNGAMLGSAAGFLLFLQARTYPEILLTAGLFILANALLVPAVTALLSRQATTQQGMLMGWNNAAMSLARILGPLAAGSAFDLNFDYPFIGGAVIMGIGFLLSLRRIIGTAAQAARELDGSAAP
jgi:DHA1 family multidrug resistance protein-like MFS transporter